MDKTASGAVAHLDKALAELAMMPGEQPEAVEAKLQDAEHALRAARKILSPGIPLTRSGG